MLWTASLHTSKTIQGKELPIQINTAFNLQDLWTVTLPGVKTRVDQRLDGCLHLLAGLSPGRRRDRKRWPHQLWMQSTLQVQRLQRKPCGFATLSMTFASQESTSIQSRCTLTATQP